MSLRSPSREMDTRLRLAIGDGKSTYLEEPPIGPEVESSTRRQRQLFSQCRNKIVALRPNRWNNIVCFQGFDDVASDGLLLVIQKCICLGL